SGYGGKESNPMPGFESTVDISGYKSGTHQLRVDLISKSGEILNSKVTSFRVRKATSKMWLETPNIDSIYRVNVNIEGWALSEDSRDRVQIEINGKVISNDVGRLKRDDVLAKINGYGEKSKNPTPGFSYILDVSDYDVGDYMLTVKLIDSHDQILIQTSRKIKIAGKPIKGIDVSAYQKTIDWKKVKNSGIEFAMIRLSTHRNGKMQKDPYFDYNVKEAKKYGVAIGAYLYSYAGNESEAIKEAEFAYSILKNYPKTFTFPIAFDIEDPNIHANLSSSQRTLISKAFCERLNSKGYYTTIYSYRSYLDKFDFNFLKGNDYWVAEWNKTCNFKQEYGMWQYTSNGKVDGITGRVDMNYAYINYPKYIKEKHLNHL
ncbi:glycoside hydrolase family 25 protein, partial [Longibaculum muris]|uniref:glycoside hydrolase family 25 protein n=1 Tax=Longibaculum muris TaxID=1796628 RepID=UPI0022E74731